MTLSEHKRTRAQNAMPPMQTRSAVRLPNLACIRLPPLSRAEIERRCQLFPRDVEHAAMRRQGFFPHEGRDIVLGGVNMRAGIEALFVPSVCRPSASTSSGVQLPP